MYEENEALSYIEKGNTNQRITAICSLDNNKRNLDIIFNVFLSDINPTVRCNALCWVCHYYKDNIDKIYELLELVLEIDVRDNLFTRIIAKKLLEYYKISK